MNIMVLPLLKKGSKRRYSVSRARTSSCSGSGGVRIRKFSTQVGQEVDVTPLKSDKEVEIHYVLRIGSRIL